jgi:DNA-binding protein YbaB
MTHSGTEDPLAGFDTQIAQLRARAELAQAEISAATVGSPDAAVTVTVGAGGALTDVQFGPSAYTRPPQQLAALVMQLVDRAQQQVSAKVVSAFGGLVGENSAAMDVLTQFLPADPAAEDEQTPPRQENPPIAQSSPPSPAAPPPT